MFGETLVERLSKVAVLVAVLSPRYVKSEWCLKELGEFCARAASSLGLQIGDKSRVFKVVKLPPEEYPEQVRNVLGYEFFEYDSERRLAREFCPGVTPARDIRYWEKLDDLAYDITQMLGLVRRGSPAPAATAGKTVYLSETTTDLTAERELIRRELQFRGHVVLPDRALPLRGDELRAVVRESLGPETRRSWSCPGPSPRGVRMRGKGAGPS